MMTRILLTVLLAAMVGLTFGCSDGFDTKAYAQDSHETASDHDHDDDDHGHAHGADPDEHDDHDHGAVPDDDQDHVEEAEADGHEGHDHAEDEHPSVAVTKWSDGMELFMEYPVLIAGEGGRFIIHLTHLDGFQPVRSGQVELVFRDSHGHGFRVSEPNLLREGIFAPTVEIGHTGQLDFTLIYTGENTSASFVIDDFVVVGSDGELPHSDEEALGSISFLKEQQWKIPFATIQAEVREMRSAVTGVATVASHPDASMSIVAPVAGIIGQTHLFAPGQEVREGDSIFTLLPLLDTEGSWADLQSRWEQATTDWERAQRLHDQNAISDRDYDQIRLNYETLQTVMASAGENSSGSQFTVQSPLSATVAERFVSPGEAVEAGQPIMQLVKRGHYRITAQVFRLPDGGANAVSGLAMYLPGSDKDPLVLNDVSLVAAPVRVDPATQAIPVQLDVFDSTLPLQIGQRVRAELFGAVELNSLAIPESSIYLDEGMDVVYVQTSGESFEKRLVIQGSRDGGWVAVEGDIHPGEHVVSTGGYHVKLASMSGEIGHGHAH
jgi:membrane fusion protein, heavy metal efflux system